MSAIATSKFASSYQAYARAGSGAGNRSGSLAAAQTLTTFLGANGSADDEDKAKSLFETYKDSVELSDGLARSVENNKDAMRRQKIEMVQKRIERLKEMLRFATPEQAKRLLKELKQISKEFKSASQDLKSAGQGLSGGGVGTGVLSGASNVAATADVITGAGTQVNATSALVETVPAAASSPETQIPVSGSETGAATSGPESQATGQAQTGAEQDGSSAGAQEPDSWREDLKAAVLTYTEQQQETNKALAASRRSGLQGDKEALAKMAEDIKSLAQQIERLLKRDERDTKKDLKDVRADLKDGVKALRASDFSAQPGPASTASPAGTDGVSTATGSTSVSLQVSDILV